MRVIEAPAVAASHSRRVEDEGATFRKADLRQVQGHPAQWYGADYLRQPQAQAAPGLIFKGRNVNGSYRWCGPAA